MKATGIVRRIDDLGRVVIPKEIRRTMRIREGDPLEIYTDREGEVIFKKYSPIGELGVFASQYAEILSKTSGHGICITDKDNVIAVSGASKKELMDKKISQDIEEIIEEKETYVSLDHFSADRLGIAGQGCGFLCIRLVLGRTPSAHSAGCHRSDHRGNGHLSARGFGQYHRCIRRQQ